MDTKKEGAVLINTSESSIKKATAVWESLFMGLGGRRFFCISLKKSNFLHAVQMFEAHNTNKCFGPKFNFWLAEFVAYFRGEWGGGGVGG